MAERIILDPRRVAHLTEVPSTPFIKMWIGDYELSSLPPNYLISFSLNKSPSSNASGSDFTISIFDARWDEVEEALMKAAYVNEGREYTTQVRFMYGYAEGEQSPVYNAYSVLTYTVDLKSSGVILVITGILKDSVDNMTPMTLGTGTNNPTQAAKEISKKLGYQIDDRNFDASKNMDLPNAEQYSLINDNPIKYISTVLAPQAIRESDGSTGYKFWLDDTTDPPSANFRPFEATQETVRSYVYQKGVNTTVLDLQMNIEWMFGGTGISQTTTRVTSQVIDANGTVRELSQDLDSARTIVTGNRSLTSPTQSTRNINGSGYSASQMDAILKYRLSSDHTAGYEGTIRVMGEIGIKVSDRIRLIVLTEGGILHHSSGVYMIKQISDNISAGEFTTSMQIWKTENLTDGLVIANYRKVVK